MQNQNYSDKSIHRMEVSQCQRRTDCQLTKNTYKYRLTSTALHNL